MDGFGWALAASGTLCRSKVQDSNDEACSEVAEVPYKVRGMKQRKKQGGATEQSRFLYVFCWERSYFIDIDYIFNSSNKIASKKRGRDQLLCFPKRQALRQARAETAALSCRSDIPEVWMMIFWWPLLGHGDGQGTFPLLWIDMLEDGGQLFCCVFFLWNSNRDDAGHMTPGQLLDALHRGEAGRIRAGFV